ncbi:hypothetical protein PybrP1_010343 [[Pythium] brassicae (nom. inval.)]|nr:hypothetical protein PybrP1_010343 [[Pythium] brassicae (nom. inval.)]
MSGGAKKGSDAAPLSPTRCRPQHLDRERLRTVLSSAQFADVLYQEAVVAAARASPRSFQLLALAADCVYLFPLTSSQQHTAPTRIAFERVLAVDVASPTLSGQRGMVVEPSSQLFHIVVRDLLPRANAKSSPTKSERQSPSTNVRAPVVRPPEASVATTEYFVSTFEPDSRVFFYVSRAFQAHFQVCAEQQHTGSELSELLDALITELVAEPDHLKKSLLLNELAIAGTCNRQLQTLFFANRTRLISVPVDGDEAEQSARGGGERSDSALPCLGLPALLIRDLLMLLVTSRHSVESGDKCDSSCLGIASLEYAASALNVLVCMCFRGQLLAERLRFFANTSMDDFVDILTTPARRCQRRHRHLSVTSSFDRDDRGRKEEDEAAAAAATLAIEEILDLQVALALELEALQQEANMVDGSHLSHRQSTHIPQLLLRSRSFAEWVGKLFKRICRSVARVPVELESLQANRQQGSPWSLALWRNAKLLDMLWNAPCANADVLALLRETRVDYINVNDGTGAHMREIAMFLQRLREAVTQGSARCYAPS